MTTSRLQQRFTKLTEQKQVIVLGTAKLGMAQLSFHPNSEAWSILDVLDHLVRVEQAFLKAARRHLPDGMRVSLTDRVRSLMVIGVMRSPMRVKVPPQAAMALPSVPGNIEEIFARWDNVREDMAELISGLQLQQTKCGVFRHPVGGWMAMDTALSFLAAHIRHHEYQLDRLKQR